ncbi:MAG: ABC transporter permease [Capsulimonadales bacterium]|nr:ABC transporter permease [Capsulimonadales bacterium]
MNARSAAETLRSAGLLAVCLSGGLFALALVILLVGASPLSVAAALWQGAFGSPYNAADTLVQTVPLLLTGLAVALSFRCQLFNIGAEGQLLVGAMAATWAGTSPLPAPLLLPMALLAGAGAGALWSGIAGLLRLYRGVQEVLSSLLLNFVAIQMLAWMVRGPLQEAEKAFPQSDPLLIPARLSLLIPGTRLHSGAVLALLLAVVVWAYLRWTVGGFALRVVGAGPAAAEAAGIPVRRTMIETFLLSGALSGLAGAIQVTGVLYRLSEGFSPGYGYTAIAVALIANLSPLSVIPSALFFGALTTGGPAVQQSIPGVSSVVVQVLQAVALFSLLAYARVRERQSQTAGGVR